MTIHTYAEFLQSDADLDALQAILDKLHEVRCDCLREAETRHSLCDEFKTAADRIMDVISETGFEMSDLKDAVAKFEEAA